MIRETCPYSNVIMIGDGITDLEAVQVRRGEEQYRGEGGASGVEGLGEGVARD